MALLILALLTSTLVPSRPSYAHPATSSTAGSALKATGSINKYWVTTFANARGLQKNGILYAGRNYVYCKMDFITDPRTNVRDAAGNYNKWWLWTDMDTGGQDYVSAYYLSKWGNDEAKDDNGQDIPLCPTLV